MISVDEEQEQWLLSEMHESGLSLAELKNETLGFQRRISL
jgi:hypothetical protein